MDNEMKDLLYSYDDLLRIFEKGIPSSNELVESARTKQLQIFTKAIEDAVQKMKESGVSKLTSIEVPIKRDSFDSLVYDHVYNSLQKKGYWMTVEQYTSKDRNVVIDLIAYEQEHTAYPHVYNNVASSVKTSTSYKLGSK